MDEASITQYITGAFDDVQIQTVDGSTFFFYGADHMLPFATLVTNDDHDHASDLNRPSVFRLNVGVSKDTYRALFGPLPPSPGASGIVDTGHDFTVLDQLLPHPVYASVSWVCVLNPSDVTFQTVRSLLTEAYEIAAVRAGKRAARG